MIRNVTASFVYLTHMLFSCALADEMYCFALNYEELAVWVGVSDCTETGSYKMKTSH